MTERSALERRIHELHETRLMHPLTPDEQDELDELYAEQQRRKHAGDRPDPLTHGDSEVCGGSDLAPR